MDVGKGVSAVATIFGLMQRGGAYLRRDGGALECVTKSAMLRGDMARRGSSV